MCVPRDQTALFSRNPCRKRRGLVRYFPAARNVTGSRSG
jgi:hypothetical protein